MSAKLFVKKEIGFRQVLGAVSADPDPFILS
jgi:hypothetical protein